MPLRVFYSSSPGCLLVKKNQSTLCNFLTAKKISFEQIDLADPKNSEAKQGLFDELSSKSISCKAPIIYYDDEYLGNYDDFFESLEMENTESFLRTPGAKSKTFDEVVAETEDGVGKRKKQRIKKTSDADEEDDSSSIAENEDAVEDKNLQKSEAKLAGDSELEEDIIESKLLEEAESAPKKESMNSSSETESDESGKESASETAIKATIDDDKQAFESKEESESGDEKNEAKENDRKSNKSSESSSETESDTSDESDVKEIKASESVSNNAEKNLEKKKESILKEEEALNIEPKNVELTGKAEVTKIVESSDETSEAESSSSSSSDEESE